MCQLLLAPISELSYERKLGIQQLQDDIEQQQEDNESFEQANNKLDRVLSFVYQYIQDNHITYDDLCSVIEHIDSQSNGGLTKRIKFYLFPPFYIPAKSNPGANFIKYMLNEYGISLHGQGTSKKYGI